MLSVLFATKSCYLTKENNNKEKSYCLGKLPLCRRKLPFCWQELRKVYFALAFIYFFFSQSQITILPTQTILRQHFLPEAKNMNCKVEI